MNLPGWRLHGLAGDLAGFHSVSVNGNWRMTFAIDDGDAALVDYLDYHQEKDHEQDAHLPPPRRGVARRRSACPGAERDRRRRTAWRDSR
jgi:hypothetical protein